MKYNCVVKSGIDKNSVTDLKALSSYIQYIEESNPNCCIELNEIVENDPRTLFEPRKLDNNFKYPFKDLAFVYYNNEIVAHLVSIFNRKEISVGYKTSIKYLEIYSEIDDLNFDEYIINRLKGNVEIRLSVNEKNNQK